MNRLITVRRAAQALAAASLFALAGAAHAQFNMVPTPQCKAPEASAQEGEKEYKLDAARHLYACFPMRVYRGKLPPLLYGVAMVETEIDSTGKVVSTNVVRKPAAAEVEPWVLAMIKRAEPYPAPAKMPGATAKFTEVYFVDKSGLFQTFSLTEGQRSK